MFSALSFKACLFFKFPWLLGKHMVRIRISDRYVMECMDIRVAVQQ